MKGKEAIDENKKISLCFNKHTIHTIKTVYKSETCINKIFNFNAEEKNFDQGRQFKQQENGGKPKQSGMGKQVGNDYMSVLNRYGLL